jgi:hypothetical protein
MKAEEMLFSRSMKWTNGLMILLLETISISRSNPYEKGAPRPFGLRNKQSIAATIGNVRNAIFTSCQQNNHCKNSEPKLISKSIK